MKDMKKYLLPLLLRLLRCGLPGSAFLCLNACFRPLLATGISIYVFKQGWGGVGSSRHELGRAENVPRVTITLLLVKNGLNYRHWACRSAVVSLLQPRLVRGFFLATTSGICSMMISDLGFSASSPQYVWRSFT